MNYYRQGPPPVDFYLKTPSGVLLRYQKFVPYTGYDTKPTILICPGRATSVEKYENVIEALCHRGYHVWCLDWRGQGLSTREAGRKGYIADYKHYCEDLDYFIRTLLKTDVKNRPLVVLGHSMGAHIALRYMIDYPGFIDGAVLAAPMLDIHTGIYSKGGAAFLSNFMVKLGFAKAYVYKQGDYNPVFQPFEGNILTYNQELFYYHRHLQIHNPDIVVGGVTYGWVKATLDSIAYVNTPETLSKITVPIKIYAADNEQVVDNSGMKDIVNWLPDCEAETLKGTKHQLLAEVPDVLTHIYDGLDRFVGAHFDLPVKDTPVFQSPYQRDYLYSSHHFENQTKPIKNATSDQNKKQKRNIKNQKSNLNHLNLVL